MGVGTASEHSYALQITSLLLSCVPIVALFILMAAAKVEWLAHNGPAQRHGSHENPFKRRTAA
ncbi:MAG: hypothetical protein NVSMB31_16730 [Vulcanimicrobiaceae bacterium]